MRLPPLPALKTPSESNSTTRTQLVGKLLATCLTHLKWQFIEGCYHGIAVGCYIEGGASGPGENAQLRLRGDGSVDVCVGSSGVGQGLETVHAQIAADALGVPLATIRSVAHGSTTVVKQGYGCYWGNRSARHPEHRMPIPGRIPRSRRRSRFGSSRSRPSHERCSLRPCSRGRKGGNWPLGPLRWIAH